MTVSFPRTDILSVAFQDQTFQLQFRQEFSRTAYGTTLGKDLGPALWSPSYTTVPMYADDALGYEAKLNSLDGVIQQFEAGDLRRPYPKAYPSGTCHDGTLLSVSANNKAMALSGLAAGQVVSAGDYLSFDYGASRALHQAVETVTANGSGVTAEFEVRPHIRPGFTLSPAMAVKLKNPRGIFCLVPGSVESRVQNALFTVVSFQAIQVV